MAKSKKQLQPVDKHFTDKAAWMAAAKKFKYELSFYAFGYGSCEAWDYGDKMGEWVSEWRTHDGSEGGWLTVWQ